MKYFLSLIIILFMVEISSSQTNKVLLIGIDGCRPDAVTAASTPNLDALMANATYSLDALNTGVTSSGPGWSSLLTGVWPEKHGVFNNSFSGSDYATYPHLFQRIEEFDSTLNTVSIVQWSPINNYITLNTSDVVVNVSDHTDYVVAAANQYLAEESSDVVFLHFDDVDHAGHGYGFSPTVSQYTNSIETVDAGIGEVLNTLSNRPNYADENWAIIVATDHGGIGTSHGGNSMEERIIFMIMSGDEIENTEIKVDSILTEIPPVQNCLNDDFELVLDTPAFVEVDADPSFNFGANDDFTVECWVRTDQSGDYAILTDKDWDSGYYPGWVFSFNVSGGPWKVNVGDGTNRADVEGGEIADGEWHMLSATFDRDGMLTIYEDGLEVNQVSIAGIGDISTGFPLRFGADSDGGYGFDGNLSEVRIYDGLVSPTAISQWSCSSLESNHPNYGNLVGLWKMGEGSGDLIADLGPNNLDGTNNGGVWQSSTATISTWEYDYSNTPRQVDFMISALEHLCIPIEPAWNLDGSVLGTSCPTAIGCDPCLSFDIHLMLQGPYDTNTELMVATQKDHPSFPLEEPYSELFGVELDQEIGNEIILAVEGGNAIVDWIFIELRDGSNPSVVIDFQSGLIQSDGDVVSAVDGISPLLFQEPGPAYDSILVAVRHRNHLGIRTLNPIELIGADNFFTLDFSSLLLPILGGDEAMQIVDDTRYLLSGDANGDGAVNSVDLNAYWRIENGGSYNYFNSPSDFNLDIYVNPVDKNQSWRLNNGKAEYLD